MEEIEALGIRPLGLVFDADGMDSEGDRDLPVLDEYDGDGLEFPDDLFGVPTVGMDGRELPKDGRYLGGNHYVHIELRLDRGVSGVMSCDLFRRDQGGSLTYVASLRTTAGTKARWYGERVPITAQDKHDSITTGYLYLARPAERGDHLQGTILFESALDGLPVNREIPFSAEWQGLELLQVRVVS